MFRISQIKLESVSRDRLVFLKPILSIWLIIELYSILNSFLQSVLKSTDIINKELFLNIEFLYLNLHELLFKVLNSPFSISKQLILSIKLDTSWPYAPIFCIGAAPTVPGIRDKFSKP